FEPVDRPRAAALSSQVEDARQDEAAVVAEGQHHHGHHGMETQQKGDGPYAERQRQTGEAEPDGLPGAGAIGQQWSGDREQGADQEQSSALGPEAPRGACALGTVGLDGHPQRPQDRPDAASTWRSRVNWRGADAIRAPELSKSTSTSHISKKPV